VVRSIRRALAAGIVITVTVSALWAWSTALTSAGPVPAVRLTRNPLADYGQLASTVTGSVPEFFAATAAIFAACFLVAGLRRMNRRDA
jgi:hypothetical protein